MASINFSLEDNIFVRLNRFPWVNWSETSREELLKKRLFEKFIKTGKLSEKDEEFCEKINWDPLDEMEVREEFLEELKKIKKGPHSRMNLEKLDKLMGLK